MEHPKVFISYSWSSIEHEQWVIDLATELRESGVDAILDKWDLKEGQDAYVFMEQMVTNPEIKKVLIICDQKYSTKADCRKGGVGTETQIISKEVYDKQDQTKFVAIVCERDESGKPFLPTYYKSRIYIDLSEADLYQENFEKLLRWVFDKPLHIKPEIGNAPNFLTNTDHISLGTTAISKRCIDAVKSFRPYALGAFDEYCSTFVENMERFRIKNYEGNFDETLLENISSFTPTRNEFIHLINTVAQYGPSDDYFARLHRFFESLIPYLYRPESVTQWRETDFDNFKFIIHELFLYTLAILIKHECYLQASLFLEQPYYFQRNVENGHDPITSYTAFRCYLKSLEIRNNRLNLRRLSIRADLLNERTSGVGLEFRQIMQADFIAFLRAELKHSNSYDNWWPETLVYLGHFHSPFEIFARSASKTVFAKTKCLLGIESPSDLNPIFEAYQTGKRLPSWDFHSFDPSILVGFSKLNTL